MDREEFGSEMMTVERHLESIANSLEIIADKIGDLVVEQREQTRLMNESLSAGPHPS